VFSATEPLLLQFVDDEQFAMMNASFSSQS
jgi:hypothetical protein